MSKRFSVEAIFKAVDQVTGPIRKMQSALKDFTYSATKGMSKVNDAFKKTDALLRTGFSYAVKGATWAVGGLTTALLGVTAAYSKVENAEALFTPLLYGAEKAREMVKKLNQVAKETPFGFETLYNAAAQLLPNMKGDINGTIELMKRLGDTAGGSVDRFQRIVAGYNKAMNKGRPDMESLQMIGEANVPILEELRKVMGLKTTAQVFKMSEASRITLKNLQDAIISMTSKGGMFFEAMLIASETTTGRFNELKDTIVLTAAAIGKVLSPYVKEFIDYATRVAEQLSLWVEKNEYMIRKNVAEYIEKMKIKTKEFWVELKRVVKENDLLAKTKDIIFGMGRAMLFLVNHGKQIATVIAAYVALSAAVKVATLAFTVFNFIIHMNPLVRIASLVVALGAAFVYCAQKAGIFRDVAAWMKETWANEKEFYNNFFDGFISNTKDAIRYVKELLGLQEKAIPNSSAWMSTQLQGFAANDDDSTPQPLAATPMPIRPGSKYWSNESQIERRTVEKTELVIKDETGRAEFKRKPKTGSLKLERTGGF